LDIQEIASTWREANEEAIRTVTRLVYGTGEDYEKAFQLLALTITTTDVNPWSFMPRGWEGAKESAQTYESFLHMLHHAMCDDGDVSFIEHEIHGSCMVMHNSNDTDLIHKEVMKRYPLHRAVRANDVSQTYVIHTDVYRFIKALQDET